MTPDQFVNEWSRIGAGMKEISASQSHFNDICALVGHKTPIAYDPTGEIFGFEKSIDFGRADVYFQNKFVWEYKKKGVSLDKAHTQLLRYRKPLGNPPLLIVSDLETIRITTNDANTNFYGTVTETYEITFDDIRAGHGVDLLKRVFHDPYSFKPSRTKIEVTEATADAFISVTDALKAKGEEPEALSHFFARIFFCLFAEDVGLLPDRLFQNAMDDTRDNHDVAEMVLKDLFAKMRGGGTFGPKLVKHFNGNLFEDDFVPSLDGGIVDKIAAVAKQDWGDIEPSIFGQLFERVIASEKRAQLGAHYTSQADIELIVNPVLIQPLETEWETLSTQIRRALRQADQPPSEGLREAVRAFHQKIASIRVLDPACGSGNFLYVALQKLMSLQLDVINGAEKLGETLGLTVSPTQLYGIEKSTYAYELAQVVIWVGYLQWRITNGFTDFTEPILPNLYQIENRDAILAYDKKGTPTEPEWPPVDIIIGNPPFLGSRKIRPELGEKYSDDLTQMYSSGDEALLPDLVTFWFEKARRQLIQNAQLRVGLISTNSIRGGSNRKVLDRIKEIGDIFFAWSDNSWILDGASVRVSIIGFDGGQQINKTLDGIQVSQINSDLTTSTNVTVAENLEENSKVSFQGIVIRGPFRLPKAEAKKMINDDEKNASVLRLRMNGQDITKRSSETFVIDFGVEMSEEEAKKYILPYDFVKKNVYPARQTAKQQKARDFWWLHWNPRPEMREKLKPLSRFVATPTVSKHRIFVWLKENTFPDHQLIVFVREDDYFFGVLHSKVHEMWALRLGTFLGVGNDPRYTPTTTFETFPFPWAPGEEPSEEADERVSAIAESARQLVALRQDWLHNINIDGQGSTESVQKKRTLTNLYNGLVDFRENYLALPPNEREQAWRKSYKSPVGWLSYDTIVDLHDIHTELDEAVVSAYGWEQGLTDTEILERLLALNLERAAGQD